MRNGIAAVLIVKNEEKVLARCLESLADLDQIVVLDTGSTDRTLEIAREHTEHVFTTEPIVPFHFAEARNRALEFAKQDWILTIDADEVLRPGAVKSIRKALWRLPAISGYQVNFVLYDQNGENPSRLPKLKLFRKDRWKWFYRVHEQLFSSEKDVKVKNLMEVSIEHRPVAAKEARQGQNLELLKLAILENPEYVRNIRQLGMEHYSRQEWSSAVEYLESFLKSDPQDRLDKSEVQMHVGIALSMLGNYEESVAAFESAEKTAPERREILYHKGVALVKGCYLDLAVEAFEKCLAIPPSSKPDFYLNVDSVWDGSAVMESLEFCRSQIAEAKKKYAALQAQAGKDPV